MDWYLYPHNAGVVVAAGFAVACAVLLPVLLSVALSRWQRIAEYGDPKPTRQKLESGDRQQRDKRSIEDIARRAPRTAKNCKNYDTCTGSLHGMEIRQVCCLFLV